jgi:catechol 2,3-dioxygenase-like lactoylglutathione lyase family enzyme
MTMKRLHISISVSHLDDSIAFYSSLFAEQPTVVHGDYAKWLLDDPRVNFVIEQSTKKTGLTHAGIQTEDAVELDEMFERMQAADAPYLAEGTTTCCYAKSDKSWTTDPDGLPWEAFLTHHQIEDQKEDGQVSNDGCVLDCCQICS